MKKVLILLTALIIYTNYENYIKQDIEKLNRQVQNLKTSIERERKINSLGYTKENLSLNYHTLIFNGDKVSYSKAMGKIQNQINKAASESCKVKSISWAQAPTKKDWYQKLKMNVRLECTPNEVLKFTNILKSNKNLYVMQNLTISKNQKKSYLNVSLQLINFRTSNENK